MTFRAQDLLREALTLTSAQRADVAAELLASMQRGDSPAEIEAAWATEIEK